MAKFVSRIVQAGRSPVIGYYGDPRNSTPASASAFPAGTNPPTALDFIHGPAFSLGPLGPCFFLECLSCHGCTSRFCLLAPADFPAAGDTTNGPAFGKAQGPFLTAIHLAEIRSNHVLSLRIAADRSGWIPDCDNEPALGLFLALAFRWLSGPGPGPGPGPLRSAPLAPDFIAPTDPVAAPDFIDFPAVGCPLRPAFCLIGCSCHDLQPLSQFDAALTHTPSSCIGSFCGTINTELVVAFGDAG